MTVRQNLDRLLRPRSVAVVGASERPGALGASLLANLDRQAFAGPIHPINPKSAQIGGRPCLPSIDALPDGVDAAVLAVPRAAVLDSIRALAARGVGAAVIFAAGFAESGEAGLADQREIARIAAAAGMVTLGPNCLGLVNFVAGIPLTFVELPVPRLAGRPGLAIVSQSGAMAAVLGVTLLKREIGLSYSISTGNEAATGVEDYIEYLADDPDTRVIAMIVEQFRNPARFLRAAARIRAAGKSIVLLHPGRSSAARLSAATHTGAMAGDHAMMAVKVGQEGVLLVETLEMLGDVAEIMLRCPAMGEGGTIVLGESGAYKALTLDLASSIGLELPVITDADSPALRAALPDFVPVSNPLDVTAQGLSDPDLYRRALQAMLADQRFGSALIAMIQTDQSTCDIKFPPVIETLIAAPLPFPVVVAGLDEGAAPAVSVAALRAHAIPYFPTAERATRALSAIAAWRRRDPPSPPAAPLRLAGLQDASGILAEYHAKALLASLGVPFSPGRLVRTLAEAQEAATELGYPVVLKAQSPSLPHKSEAGGVVVGLRDAASLAAGWTRLESNIARHRPDLVLDGVLVEAMAAPGVEMILGARRDPDWGAVLLVGLGGIQAELFADIRLAPANLSEPAIAAEILRLRGAALLTGFRGAPPCDVAALARLAAILGRLVLGEPRIAEIDLNPVRVQAQGSGVLALDALMELADTDMA